MLDAYIIEEIKRREKERQREERSRPQIEIPRPEEQDEPARRSDRDEQRKTNGVVTVNL